MDIRTRPLVLKEARGIYFTVNKRIFREWKDGNQTKIRINKKSKNYIF
jgi:hypothetical protein